MANKTEDAVDTGRADAANTSTDEDDDDTSLEDDESSWDDGEVVDDDSESEDSSANDDSDEEGDDSAEDVDDDTEDSDSSEEEDDDSEDASQDEDSDAAKEKTALEAEKKRHNDEMAKARIAEAKAKRAAEEARKAAEDATIERYLADAGDDADERQRRENNVEQYRIREEKISLNQERLETGIEKAIAKIPLFQTGSPEVQEELARSLDDFERMYVRKDANGRPLEVHHNVFEYLQAKADSIERLTGLGARQQVTSKTKQKTRVDTPPVRAPKKAKADPGLDAFDEEANRW